MAMKRLIRLLSALWPELLALALSILLLGFVEFMKLLYYVVVAVIVVVAVSCLASCTTTQYVPVETVRTDSVRVVDVRRDSIYIMDSVIVKSKADTVYITRWRTEYNEALRIDTLLRERIDTMTVEKTVEKQLTEWEQLSLDVGNGVLWVAIIAAIGAIVWVVIKIAI